MSVPLLDLGREYAYMKAGIDAAIRACLDHQRWILGPEVGRFEQAAAGYLGTAHCIGASSGTDALVLALRALAIKTKGKEYFDKTDAVITTPFTFTATGDAILRAGATPLFADIDPATFNIDPARIEACLSGRPPHLSIVGILPVHLYGRPCPMGEIVSIAQARGLFVLEDTAQAFGATCGGKKCGATGDAGAFSFFPSKNLGGFGDAGLVATNDAELARLVRMLIKHGGKDKYNVEHVGYNARMDTLQAAVLLEKLPHIDDFNARRRRIAALYDGRLRDLPYIALPSGDTDHVYHQYTIRVPRGRDALKDHLAKNGIESAVYYPYPLHMMRLFSPSSASAPLYEAEKAAREVLSLPMGPLMEDGEAEDVVSALKSFTTG
jgi:dTDP-4-amino-4,6-dideoxygalactose transaminase